MLSTFFSFLDILFAHDLVCSLLIKDNKIVIPSGYLSVLQESFQIKFFPVQDPAYLSLRPVFAVSSDVVTPVKFICYLLTDLSYGSKIIYCSYNFRLAYMYGNSFIVPHIPVRNITAREEP